MSKTTDTNLYESFVITTVNPKVQNALNEHEQLINESLKKSRQNIESDLDNSLNLQQENLNEYQRHLKHIMETELGQLETELLECLKSQQETLQNQSKQLKDETAQLQATLQEQQALFQQIQDQRAQMFKQARQSRRHVVYTLKHLAQSTSLWFVLGIAVCGLGAGIYWVVHLKNAELESLQQQIAAQNQTLLRLQDSSQGVVLKQCALASGHSVTCVAIDPSLGMWEGHLVAIAKKD